LINANDYPRTAEEITLWALDNQFDEFAAKRAPMKYAYSLMEMYVDKHYPFAFDMLVTRTNARELICKNVYK
jgi:hypothetical protein